MFDVTVPGTEVAGPALGEVTVPLSEVEPTSMTLFGPLTTPGICLGLSDNRGFIPIWYSFVD